MRDILEISFGEPQEEISEELDDDVVLHRNFEGGNCRSHNSEF